VFSCFGHCILSTNYQCHLDTVQVCLRGLQEIEHLLRVSCYLYFGKAEHLSYGCLMRFNREIADGLFRLLKQTIHAMSLHQRPRLLYSMDEIGRQLTYSSGNQRVFVGCRQQY
jgi:hypothetical protein